MKQKLSPVTAVVILLVVVIVIAALGYFIFKSKGGGGSPETNDAGLDVKEKQMDDPAIEKMQQEQQPGVGDARAGGY